MSSLVPRLCLGTGCMEGSGRQLDYGARAGRYRVPQVCQHVALASGPGQATLHHENLHDFRYVRITP